VARQLGVFRKGLPAPGESNPACGQPAPDVRSSAPFGQTAPIEKLREAIAVIPNAGVTDWEAWNAFGLALWAATGGSEEGRLLFHDWSRKNAAYAAKTTGDRWDHYATSPPGSIGAGTIFSMAGEVRRQQHNGESREEKEETRQQEQQEQHAPPPPRDPEPDLEVLRLNRRAAPDFPMQVFSGEWGAWIYNTAASACCPVDYVAAPLLSTASALIGNARWALAWQGWTEPPHLWLGSVGDSGDGKSPGTDALMRHVIPTLEARMCEGFDEHLRDWQTKAEEAKATLERWQNEVKEAVKIGAAPPASLRVRMRAMSR
jgi:hypothetical protein